MNCCVPEFAVEDDNGIFPSFFMPKNIDPPEEDFAELLWQKGPVLRRRTSGAPSALPSRTEPSVWSYSAANPVAGTELFMEEDEMASWLDYPLGEDEGGGGMGGGGGEYRTERMPATGGVQALDRGFQVPEADVGGWAASGRPPLPPEAVGKLSLFPREREPKAAAAATRDSTVVGSSMAPWLLARGHAPESITSSGDVGGGTGTLENGHTSSSGGICEGEAMGKAAPLREDRKRKAREGDDSDYHSEDAEFESSELKEGSRRSASKRRLRAAEVHNLSERRRRDRINEKMKALQQLIPRCNKSDKASMLDDAIEYLKALQMQVHMMSMGCNMVPMMFAGMQQYVPPMGMAMPMGMSMGLGMGMEMGVGALNHPMAPFLPVMSGSHMIPAGASPMSTGVSMKPFHAPATAGFSDKVKLQAAGQTDPAACPAAPARAQAPNHSQPCQQYAAFHPSSQAQVLPRPQSHATAEQGSSRGTNVPEKPKIGISRRMFFVDLPSYEHGSKQSLRFLSLYR